MKSVFSSIGVMAALTISSKLIRLIILMITARFLTSEDFGVVAAFTMVYTLAYVISEMGIVRTIIQRPIISDKHIGSALFISLTICISVSISLYLFSGYIAALVNIPQIMLPLKISSLMFLILGFSNVCSAIFQKNNQILLIGKLQAYGTIFGNVFVTVPLLYFDLGYWSIIIGLWVSELLSIVVITFLGWKLLSFKMRINECMEIIKYSIAFFFNHTLTVLSQQIDIAIVSRYFGSAILGDYSRAMQLITFPNQIYMLVVDRVVFPVMAKMESDKEKLVNFFTKTFSVLSLVLCIGVLILVFGAKEIVVVMMGSGWERVSDLLSILAYIIIFRALTSYMNSFLAAYGLVKLLTYKQILSLGLMCLTIYFLTPYGIDFLAYGVVGSSMLQFFITVFCIVYFTEFKASYLIEALLPTVLTTFFITSFYSFSYYTFALSGLLNICITVIIYTLIGFFVPINIVYTKKGTIFFQNLKKYIHLKILKE